MKNINDRLIPVGLNLTLPEIEELHRIAMARGVSQASLLREIVRNWACRNRHILLNNNKEEGQNADDQSSRTL